MVCDSGVSGLKKINGDHVATTAAKCVCVRECVRVGVCACVRARMCGVVRLIKSKINSPVVAQGCAWHV